MGELIIEEYSTASLVVRGNTKPWKEEIKKLGAKWNINLSGGPGWVIAKSARLKLDELNEKIDRGEVDEAETVEYKKPEYKNTESSIKDFVSMKLYLSLLARVEKLETLVCHSDFVNDKKSKENPTGDKSKETGDNEDDTKPVQRLMHRKLKN